MPDAPALDRDRLRELFDLRKSYNAHFGGAYYHFLRGMTRAGGPERGVFFARPERAVVRALDDLLAGEASERRWAP